MSKIVECVPNFSEGIRKDVIDAIAEAIRATEGCSLLDVDPGASTNRTVYTFVGAPDAVVEGAVNAASVAKGLIDMTKHKGEHPRLGAMDVCPFIPVKGVTMEECIQCANKCAKKLADQLNLPSYLYGAASTRDYRRATSQIRTGEYEGLKEKLKKDEWRPDYGPGDFNPGWGASLVGARNFLIAYNVNLIATKEQAHRIALDIREQGRGDKPGKFKCVQAIGWYLEEESLSQISINITDINVTSIHEVYEECVAIAKSLDLPVVGSQVVGLVPLKALLEAAEYYIKRDRLFVVNEGDKIRLAIERMALNSLGPFKPKERIIEYMVSSDEASLLSLPVDKFVRTVAERSPTPGGGSVAALSASLGCGLSTMASFLTYGNKKFAHLDKQMRVLIEALHTKTEELLTFVQRDAAAFDEFMTALKMPKKTPEDVKAKDLALAKALDHAASVPFTLMTTINQCWPTLLAAAPLANVACLSDLQVGVRCLETGVWGGHYNVLANIKNMEDKAKAAETHKRSKEQVDVAVENSAKVLAILDERYLKE